MACDERVREVAASHRARRAESQAVEDARRTVNTRRRAEEPPDDLALAQKVESQLFRHAGVPKGRSA